MPIESRLFPDVGSSELTRSLGIDTDNRPPAIDRGYSRLTSELEENGTRFLTCRPSTLECSRLTALTAKAPLSEFGRRLAGSRQLARC